MQNQPLVDLGRALARMAAEEDHTRETAVARARQMIRAAFAPGRVNFHQTAPQLLIDFAETLQTVCP